MSWCEIDGKLFVKSSGAESAKAGIVPGMEIVSVDGAPTEKWLVARVASAREFLSFSTDHQARYYGLHWGLMDAPGTKRKFKIRDAKGKLRLKTLKYGADTAVVAGPAAAPEGMRYQRSIGWSKTSNGFGYIHVRRCKKECVDELDVALEGIGAVRGVILDFRGNSGGGFDHDAFLSRFVPAGGKPVRFRKRTLRSQGRHAFGGPVVVIVDGTVRSAGETGSGMFKEEGRAYMIGPSPTAGMSSSKKTIQLPSGMFELYVSVFSNKAWFNEGRGIEGIGVVPHETLTYRQEDLLAGKDTMISRASVLLEKGFPKRAVAYDPKRAGWRPPNEK